MTVHGAFFEVTGAREELDRIYQGMADIEYREGMPTASDSFSMDLWGEMLDEWFVQHDLKVLARYAENVPRRYPVETIDGVTAEKWLALHDLKTRAEVIDQCAVVSDTFNVPELSRTLRTTAEIVRRGIPA
jgi:hypothetical protein